MDGTTAGQLGFAAPLPQPESISGGNLSIDHTAAVTTPSPTPVPQAAPLQPQYSQLTPVYAPSPTNTVNDIPQPPVKGIEFVKAPTLTPSPVPTQPLPPSMPAVMPTPVSPPVPQPAQVIQPILPPPLPPVQASIPVTPVVTEPTAMPPVANQSPNESTIQKIENKIEDVDLDQMVGAVPVTAVNNPALQPSLNQSGTSTDNYFQDTKPQGDIVITNNARGSIFSKINSRVVRIVIIVLIIAALSIGGYFIVKAVTGGQKASQTSGTTKSKTPVAAQPVFTEPTTASTTTTDTSTSTDTTTTPATDTTTDTTPAATDTTTPAVTTTPTPSSTADTTPSSPAVANTGLEW